MEFPIYYSPLILEAVLILRCLCFHSPIILGVPILWAWSILWAQPYSRRYLSCLLYHTTSLGASSYSYHSTFTQPSHTTTQGLQLSLDRWIGRRYPTPHTLPHSSMLSLSYLCYGAIPIPVPMPIPMVVPQPCTHHTRTRTQSHERPRETHSEPWARHRHHHWHSVAQREPQSQSQRQAPPKPSPFFNFCEGRSGQLSPRKSSLRLKGVEILFFLDFLKGVPHS